MIAANAYSPFHGYDKIGVDIIVGQVGTSLSAITRFHIVLAI